MTNKFHMLRFLTFVRNDISPYYDTVSPRERQKGRGNDKEGAERQKGRTLRKKDAVTTGKNVFYKMQRFLKVESGILNRTASI